VLATASLGERAAKLGACFVFGGEAGRRVREVKRAWETAVLKAHGHAPIWTGHALSRESRAVFQRIDVVFHDLRHEAGSRLLESGWPLHQVAHMLGHASVETTNTYLNATRVGLQDAMRRLDAARCKVVANADPVEQAPPRNAPPPASPQPLIN
jgi:integrase